VAGLTVTLMLPALADEVIELVGILLRCMSLKVALSDGGHSGSTTFAFEVKWTSGDH
jgi:hypothetical protein